MLIRVRVLLYGTETAILQRQKISLKKVSFKKGMLCDLVTKSNGFFKDLSEAGV